VQAQTTRAVKADFESYPQRQRAAAGRRRRDAGILLRCAFVAGTALVAANAPARSADVALERKIPASVVAQGWAGLYGGAHAGFGWGKKIFVDNFPVFDGEIDAEPRVSGGIAGLHAGYNHQIGRVVLGAEVEFTWSGIGNDRFPCFHFGDQLCSAKPQWFATAAGRIGVTNGLALFYLKGGAAWVHDHYFNIATCAGSQPIVSGGVTAACGVPFYANQTRLGWMVGAGIERFIGRHWSLKLEYSYMDFGARSVPFEDGGGGFFTEEIHQKINTVKLGVNYYFGAAPQPAADAPAMPAKAGNNPAARVSAFSGFDVSKYNYSGYVGALFAPAGDIEESGPRLYLLGDISGYKYRANGDFIRGLGTGADFLAGYALAGDSYVINLLAGGNAANHMLSAIDTTNSVQGTAFGAKARADAWINPTPQTMMYGEAEYSTAFQTYLAKAKVGVDATAGQQVFVGPEAAILGNSRFRQWRVGMHVTQLRIGQVQLEAAAGFARDTNVGNGAYGSIGLSTDF
jgi:outer membrane immunogenic protein